MRVWGHVVQARPGSLDRRVRRGRIAPREPRNAVRNQRLVDHGLPRPAGLGVAHREHEALAAPAKVEARLRLDHHRQLVGEAGDGRGLEQLPAERADGQLDADLRAELGRPGPARDHEHFAGHVLGGHLLPHVDAELRRAAQQFRRDGRRVGDAVAPAARRAEHVGGGETGNGRGRVDELDRHAELELEQPPLLQLCEALLGRGEEQVADLAEEARPERGEEGDALAGEHDLLRGRELLPHAAHRARGRAAREPAALGDDDVLRAEEREVVRDAGADGAGAGDDYPASHGLTASSSSAASAAVRPRSGARTSSRSGTPRPRTTCFSAAWRGKRSTTSRRATRRPLRSRTAATTCSGKALASAETAPAAPPSSPRPMNASGPTKTSRPSLRYGSNRSYGVSETFMPARLSAASRRRASAAEEAA